MKQAEQVRVNYRAESSPDGTAPLYPGLYVDTIGAYMVALFYDAHGRECVRFRDGSHLVLADVGLHFPPSKEGAL